jgi:hypothetical protein
MVSLRLPRDKGQFEAVQPGPSEAKRLAGGVPWSSVNGKVRSTIVRIKPGPILRRLH